MPQTPRLKWLPEAVSDLVRLRAFIQDHNPEAAHRAAQRLFEGIEKLNAFPLIGRPVQDIEAPLFRDLFIPFGQTGYWLRYVATKKEILIVRIWHGREDGP